MYLSTDQASETYLRSYLRDIIGMAPEAAKAYVDASPAHKCFTSMRVVYDRSYDPRTHDLAEEEFLEGRVTLKVEDGIITDALLERGGLARSWLKPYTPKQHGCGVQLMQPGEVFFVGSPEHITIGPRMELWVLDPMPTKGWLIQDVVSEYVLDASMFSGPKENSHFGPRKPPRPTVSPQFETVNSTFL